MKTFLSGNARNMRFRSVVSRLLSVILREDSGIRMLLLKSAIIRRHNCSRKLQDGSLRLVFSIRNLKGSTIFLRKSNLYFMQNLRKRHINSKTKSPNKRVRARGKASERSTQPIKVLSNQSKRIESTDNLS